MKYKDNRLQANLNNDKVKLIYEHLLESYEKIEKKENINIIIKHHKQFIDKLQVNSN